MLINGQQASGTALNANGPEVLPYLRTIGTSTRFGACVVPPIDGCYWPAIDRWDVWT